MMKNPLNYLLEVFWSDEDEGYIAIAPDLPGCSAWGATEADALVAVHQAISAWIEAARSAGNEIPQPGESTSSGKFLMRVPKRLHADLVRSAKREGVSLNQYVLYLLTAENTARKAAA